MIWERITNEAAVGNGVDVETDIFTEKIVELILQTMKLFGNGEVGITLYRINLNHYPIMVI